MNALETVPRFQAVPFHGGEILAVRIDDQVRVPMKRFCGTIGLPWEGQRQRIERTQLLREGASVMLVPSEGGEQEQMTLPLGLLAGFLVGVSTSRLQPELRDRVTVFQREAYDVLFRHFFRRVAPAAIPVVARQPAGPSWQQLEAARRSAPSLIALIDAEKRPAVRRTLHRLLVEDCAQLGLEPPPLALLGADGPSPDAIVVRLVQALEALTSRKIRWNHLGRANGRMALVLPEIARWFAAYDIDVAVDDALRDALARGNRHYRVTEELITSTTIGKRVLATVLTPWPVQGGLA